MLMTSTTLNILACVKIKYFGSCKNSVNSMEEKKPVKFDFIVGSHYVQLCPLASQTYMHTWKSAFLITYLYV